MKNFIKSLMPPILLFFLKKIKNNKYGWKGDYSSWHEAKNEATGYDSDEILQTVRVALLKVKNGEAMYERDSVIFDEIQYSWPLLSTLMLAAAKFENLKVLDFGGSLGSTYYQNRKFLGELNNVSWSIVEQENFVNVGKKDFGDDCLHFFCTVNECVEKENPDVLLLSSVLQYIEKPYELLDEILQYDFKYVVVDITPFVLSGPSKLKLQTVHPSIYNASYPCWIFNERSFINFFTKNKYKTIEVFKSLKSQDGNIKFKGIIFKKFDK
jgi:putative methyltransferase (TIGR04325 family)